MHKGKGLLIVFSGPSGTGKDTVLEALLRKSSTIRRSVSATTRAPRAGETDGVDYRFMTRDAFLALVARGEMLEYAEYVGNYYGTPLGPVREWTANGTDVILKIEVQGGAQVKRKYPDSVGIFIMPPSIEELERRLRGRGTDDEAAVQKRLAVAMEEMKCAPQYDYTVVNDDVENAVKDVLAVIETEKARRMSSKVQ